jgi:hypothetical protein
MSYISNIDSLEIQPAALDMMPESVARENSVLAVSASAGSLRIIIPADPGYDAAATLEKLQIVLDRPVIVDTADRERIDAAIDFHYPAKYATIDNCPPRFRFRCPKRWYELDRTDSRNVRHCTVCEQSVFLCHTESELQQYAKSGHCVALADHDEPDFLGLPEVVEDEAG